MGQAGPPLSRKDSAPLVTKLEKRFKDFPPSKLCRKLGNTGSHSPVFWGISGICIWDDRGEARGVIEELDASRFLTTSS